MNLNPSAIILQEFSHFSSFASYMSPVICHFRLFIICLLHFSMLNSFRIRSLHILTTCIKIPSYFSFFQTVWRHTSTLGCWFFPEICELCPPSHFLSIRLISIIIITKCNDDSLFPWKIPFRIFTLSKLFSTCWQFHSPFFYGILDKHYNFVGSCIFWECQLYSFAGL